jgi:hypothetical protein
MGDTPTVVPNKYCKYLIGTTPMKMVLVLEEVKESA